MYQYKCRVLEVIDGDTIDVLIDLGFHTYIRERVRLIGLDAPETFGKEASAAGRVAKKYVQDWITHYEANIDNIGGFFEYHSVKYNARDKYGRSLGELLFVDTDGKEISLNDALIVTGNAVKL